MARTEEAEKPFFRRNTAEKTEKSGGVDGRTTITPPPPPPSTSLESAVWIKREGGWVSFLERGQRIS